MYTVIAKQVKQGLDNPNASKSYLDHVCGGSQLPILFLKPIKSEWREILCDKIAENLLTKALANNDKKV